MNPYHKIHKHWFFRAFLIVTVLFGVLNNVSAESKTDTAGRTDAGLSTQPTSMEKRQGLLPDDRIVVGTVEEVKGDQIKINIGELQPRYLPLAMAKEKNLPPIQKGDKFVVTLSDQNLVVDFHPFGEPGKQRVFRGVLATPLVVGHDRAVIRTSDG